MDFRCIKRDERERERERERQRDRERQRQRQRQRAGGRGGWRGRRGSNNVWKASMNIVLKRKLHMNFKTEYNTDVHVEP